jgi:hypothetical protein
LAQAFKQVQVKGQEIVAQFLGRAVKDPDNPAPVFTIGKFY